MANNILFVYEGANTERLITDNLKSNFFDDKNVIIQCAYCTTIYNLYKEVSKDEDLDLFVLLQQMPINQEKLKSFKRDDFAEIYLFFDYDGHTTSANDEKLKKLLELFSEETEFGKLFISYPMVEALKHYTENINFKNLKVEAKKDLKYKNKVNLECNKDFINMPKYNRHLWGILIEAHLRKLNFIIYERYELPSEFNSQIKIFSAQLEKYITIDSTVAVLSSFPVFLFDYFGFTFISKFISDNKS
jgi:hypothetical protein